MRILSRFRRAVIIATFTMMLALSSLMGVSKAISDENRDTIPLFSHAELKGIDTIVVSYEVIPTPNTLLSQSPEQMSSIVNAVKELFSRQQWLSVVTPRELKDNTGQRSNVLYLHFVANAKQEVLADTEITIGSLGLQLLRYYPDQKQTKYVIPLAPITYPFALTRKENEIPKKLAAGARYLASFLPSYCAVANKHYVVDDPANKFFYNPFQE